MAKTRSIFLKILFDTLKNSIDFNDNLVFNDFALLR